MTVDETSISKIPAKATSMDLYEPLMLVERLTEDKVRAEQRLLAIAWVLDRGGSMEGRLGEIEALLESHHKCSLDDIVREIH